VNPATAFGTTFADELVRCGLREAVLAPGSRSTPLAMAFFDAGRQGRMRLHVRIDERSASFTALGLAKASRRPVAVLCTSGTAAANLHPAVIEADESAVPLLVLTADRPPELRGTGANQAIDQIKLYGAAVRWFCEAGVPERRPGMAGYWRSLACQAWAHAAGAAGGLAGPVHLNLPLREPLTPELPGTAEEPEPDWPESLDGRPDGQPWTRFHALGRYDSAASPPAGGPEAFGAAGSPPKIGGPGGFGGAGSPPKIGGIPGGRPPGANTELEWAERGVVVCGDGDYDAAGLVELAERAGWPVLAEPSSGARRGPNSLPAYQYLLGTPEFAATRRPDVIVSAGRPGLSRPQMAFLGRPAIRHVVIGQGPGRWADPQRAATDVASGIRLVGLARRRGSSAWLDGWRLADEAARHAVDAILDSDDRLTEPRLARDLVAGLPEAALLWTGSSMPVRDVDLHGAPRGDIRILASRGASGIDGTVSAAVGAALAHDGPAFALIGDLAFLHDAPGLALGPAEPRPDLCLIVVNNDGGGIFSTLEQAAFPGMFERLFGTPHGAGLHHLAAAFGLPYERLDQPADLDKVVAGSGLRVVEAPTDRAAGAALRARLRDAAAAAVRAVL
jgi:2-succinyl-5-enolpyruvyl-6-hydroxy-3-cyclohexene-1-carboxylate synthase